MQLRARGTDLEFEASCVEANEQQLIHDVIKQLGDANEQVTVVVLTFHLVT